MVEIAICLAIIGFALVAIIGILPAGLQVQKDNREDTLIGQDGEYFMEAIRSGAAGLDNLASNVDAIIVGGTWDQGLVGGTWYQTTNQNAAPSIFINTGHDVIGLLTTPSGSNGVFAIVRPLGGSAAETGTSTRDFAFRYRLTVLHTNYVNSAPELDTNINSLVSSNLHDLRLEFRWPIHADWTVGNGRQVFRALVSGTLVNDPSNSVFYFFRP